MTPSRSTNIVDTHVPLSLCLPQLSMPRRICTTISHGSPLRFITHTIGERDINIHACPLARHAVKGDTPAEKVRAFLHTHDTLMVAAPLACHQRLLLDALSIVRDTYIEMSFIMKHTDMNTGCLRVLLYINQSFAHDIINIHCYTV